ncbi:MAG: hypothetical protein V2B19_02380 [Pseudomonadota bacterium]
MTIGEKIKNLRKNKKWSQAELAGHVKDKTLYEKMKLIDTLEEADRSVISGVIDAFLTKHQMWQVLNKKDVVIQQ